MIESDRGIDLSDVMTTLRQERRCPASNTERALKSSEPERPATDQLLEQIVAPENLDQAWRRVKRNRGAPGPDALRSKHSRHKPEPSGR